MRFSANLSFLYQDLPFFERFRAAAEDGFKGVEYLFPYEHDPHMLVQALKENQLQQVLFNAPTGDWNAGERGIAAIPGREEEFRHSISTALEYAELLGNRMIHVMAGLTNNVAPREAMPATYVSNLEFAASEAAKINRTILIEPINQRDMPGYFLGYQQQAQAILRAVAAPNLKIQLDLYHAQIMEGDLETRLRSMSGTYAHIQAAGVPLRHEPDTGEVNYFHLFDVLDELGYTGWVGCEYRPTGATRTGLDWMRRYLERSEKA